MTDGILMREIASDFLLTNVFFFYTKQIIIINYEVFCYYY